MYRILPALLILLQVIACEPGRKENKAEEAIVILSRGDAVLNGNLVMTGDSVSDGDVLIIKEGSIDLNLPGPAVVRLSAGRAVFDFSDKSDRIVLQKGRLTGYLQQTGQVEVNVQGLLLKPGRIFRVEVFPAVDKKENLMFYNLESEGMIFSDEGVELLRLEPGRQFSAVTAGQTALKTETDSLLPAVKTDIGRALADMGLHNR